MIERTLCPTCGGVSAQMVIDIPFEDQRMQTFLETYYGGRVDQTFLKDHSYRVEKCGACGLLWQRWILDEDGMEKLYETWIDQKKSSQKRRLTSLPIQYAKHCARLLRLFPNPAETHVLDFGMGWGEWCQMAKSFGFQTWGTELSQSRIDYAKSNGIAAYLPSELPKEQLFDFIYLEQVMEHVPNPGELLSDLIGRLRPGGYIHIGVPNASFVSGEVSTLLKKGPAQPLEHINMFTPQSLRAVLALKKCLPARQKELLIRVHPISAFIKDVATALSRILPSSHFPPGTSLMFQKDKN